MTAARAATFPIDGHRLSAAELDFVRRLLRKQAGIVLTEQKEAMVATRLARRLTAHRCATFGEYIEVLKGEQNAAELEEFVNCLTTNKTSFFREPQHFEHLRQWLVERRQRNERRLRIWSAACSIGAEPYSIAMVVREALGDLRGWDVRILASDVDTSVVARTSEGVYSAAELEGLSLARRQEWFRPSGDGRFVVSPELRALVVPRVLNFLERPWPFKTPFDAIFCRNVMIYFDRDVQRGIYEEQARLLAPDGLYFAGHSENLHWLGPLFTVVAPTVHRRGPAAAPPPRPAPTRAVDPLRRIQAGEVFASREPAVVQTLLGSCVAACLYDPQTQIGGMNHFMLPDERDGESAPDRSVARFGIHAMELLINELARLGADRRRLVAKVFGAAHVLASSGTNVASENERFIRRFLEMEKIPLLGERLGGTEPLLVRFSATEGRAFVRTLPQASEEVATSELSFRRGLVDVERRAAPPTLF